MSSNEIKILGPKGEVKIGDGNPCFIIAEMSGNHNQDINRAKKIIEVAAESGADAIKLQTYTSDTMTIDCNKKDFIVNVNKAWKGKSLYELYREAGTPWKWHEELKNYSESKGLIFFSTPFDETAVDFLEKLNVPFYKIASFESTHIPLLKKIAKTKKPVIISRGMTSIEDLELAIKTLKDNGCPGIAILHCISSYPASLEQMNLNTITDIKKRFDVITGISDHSLSPLVPTLSLALGAKIIEKHFTLNRSEGGPDAAFSIEPQELQELVKVIRNSEKALGIINYNVEKKESENLVFRRSIYIIKDIKKGEELTEDNIKVIRPGYGMHPKFYEKMIGKTVNTDIERGTALKKELLKDQEA